jgi:acetyl esterase/lipase
MTERLRMHISGRGPRDLAAHVFRPDAARSLRTAVILLHGGAWRFGSAEAMVPYAEALARHGFVAIAAEYRLLGEAPWPAQLNDVWDAIAWTRARAGELDIDAEKIALQGFSAGGHLALLAAGRREERPECAVAARWPDTARPALARGRLAR